MVKRLIYFYIYIIWLKDLYIFYIYYMVKRLIYFYIYIIWLKDLYIFIYILYG